MKDNSHRDSIRTVVIIVLVLALVAALGWIFWQNFIYKAPVAKETGPIVIDKSNKNLTGEEKKITLQGEHFTIDYPSDWHVTFVSGDNTALSADKGLESISFSVSEGAYRQPSNGTGPVTYVTTPVEKLYASEGTEYPVGSKDGPWPGNTYAYKIAYERGQTNNAVVYILSDKRLYRFETSTTSDDSSKYDEATKKFTLSPAFKAVLDSLSIN